MDSEQVAVIAWVGLKMFLAWAILGAFVWCLLRVSAKAEEYDSNDNEIYIEKAKERLKGKYGEFTFSGETIAQMRALQDIDQDLAARKFTKGLAQTESEKVEAEISKAITAALTPEMIAQAWENSVDRMGRADPRKEWMKIPKKDGK